VGASGHGSHWKKARIASEAAERTYFSTLNQLETWFAMSQREVLDCGIYSHTCCGYSPVASGCFHPSRLFDRCDSARVGLLSQDSILMIARQMPIRHEYIY
jgi:hypothetical protein